MGRKSFDYHEAAGESAAYEHSATDGRVTESNAKISELDNEATVSKSVPALLLATHRSLYYRITWTRVLCRFGFVLTVLYAQGAKFGGLESRSISISILYLMIFVLGLSWYREERAVRLHIGRIELELTKKRPLDLDWEDRFINLQLGRSEYNPTMFERLGLAQEPAMWILVASLALLRPLI